MGDWGMHPQAQRPRTVMRPDSVLLPGRSLTGKKKFSGSSFPKKARGHLMCSTMVGGGWRLVAVGGGWRLAVGNWWLVAVGGGWRQLVVVDWWLVVGGGWQWLVVGGWAVGGPLGRSLRAVLSKKKNLAP